MRSTELRANMEKVLERLGLALAVAATLALGGAGCEKRAGAQDRGSDAGDGANEEEKSDDAATSTSASGGAGDAPAMEVRTSIDIPWLPNSVRMWGAEIGRSASAHGLDAELIAIIVLVESGGHPAAKSRSGALGLMQVTPRTAGEIATQQKVRGHSDKELKRGEYNLDFGSFYLAKMVKTFTVENDLTRTIELAAGAYNGGPNKLTRFLTKNEKLTDETTRYMEWVGGMWRERHALASPTFARWWRAGGERLVRRAEDGLGVQPVRAP
ncbi:MAG: transglycosylase SLT domain-containing protein [Polyangiaceae bacterium]